MRAPPITLTLLLAGACARPLSSPHAPAARPPTAPPPLAASSPALAAADLPRRAPVPPVAADALPRLFAEGRELDVDLDGRPDRVREIALLPRHTPDPTLPAVVLVAHALPDGRFALDDDVTRAALRALCPEDPTLTYRRVEHEEETAQGERLNALLLDAYCQQAWGRDLADLTANLRSLQRTVGADVLRTDQIEAIAQVLREFAPPITLEPLRAATLPTFPPYEPPAARPATEPVEAPLAPVCRRVVADNARVVAQADALGARVTSSQGETYSLSAQYIGAGQCAARGNEAWVVRVAQPSLRDEALTLAATLSYERAGARTTVRLDPFSYRMFVHRWTSVSAVFDWDGDGTVEAVVHQNEWQHEADGSGAVRILRARNGALVPYAPAAAFAPIQGVRDIDDDGRPDLLLPSPWHTIESCGPGPREVLGVERVAHALPDGTFTEADAVARGYLARRCETALREGVFAMDETSPELLALACARRAGASAEGVVAALRARHRDAPRVRLPGVVSGECVAFHDLAINALIAR